MADGYLADPAIENHGSDQGGRTLGQLKHVPCLVLLGAPGMGKTREAEAAVTSLRAAGEPVDLVYAGRRADPGLYAQRPSRWNELRDLALVGSPLVHFY